MYEEGYCTKILIFKIPVIFYEMIFLRAAKVADFLELNS